MEINKQNRVQIEDLMFILRKDQRKYARAKDLLIMNEVGNINKLVILI